MFDIAVERLRRIPLKRTDEVWEVAAMPLPGLFGDPGGSDVPQRMAACDRYRSRGSCAGRA